MSEKSIHNSQEILIKSNKNILKWKIAEDFQLFLIDETWNMKLHNL